MLMTVDKCALLMISFHGSFYLNCCHVKKMTHLAKIDDGRGWGLDADITHKVRMEITVGVK